jgi:hypothetical protein
MPYNKKKLFAQAKEQIEKNRLFFIEDIVAFLPCAKPTFYEYFPVGSNEMNELKELLSVNRVKVKSSIRSKLFKSSKAAELLSLYKLIATDDERRALSMNYNEHEFRGGDISVNVNVNKPEPNE